MKICSAICSADQNNSLRENLTSESFSTKFYKELKPIKLRNKIKLKQAPQPIKSTKIRDQKLTQIKLKRKN